MYNIVLPDVRSKYEYQELARVFFPPSAFHLYTRSEFSALPAAERRAAQAIPVCPEAPSAVMPDGAAAQAAGEETLPPTPEGAGTRLTGEEVPSLLSDGPSDGAEAHSAGEKTSARRDGRAEDAVKRALFDLLCQLSGTRPPWGMLTGVRPVKLTGALVRERGEEAARERLETFYGLSPDKAALLLDIYAYQQAVTGPPPAGSVALYIGIPFCPTRCLYCAFPSNQKPEAEVLRYLAALQEEIRYCGRRLADGGQWAESLYIGGGTPTTLSAAALDTLLHTVETAFDLSRLREFTVEAGRPDTITEEKLAVLLAHGVSRLSINPQSMEDETLRRIGRAHTADDVRHAFARARRAGNFILNADLIAGLPGESPAAHLASLASVIDMGADNITVHTLAVKRASRLIEADPDYHYRHGEEVARMLEQGRAMLAAAGYRPYYLYRQKQMTGAMENTGYCRDDTPCLYNIRIMEERQTVLAMGAGAISKRYYPAEDRLERTPNVTNYEIYIERLSEMLARKDANLFDIRDAGDGAPGACRAENQCEGDG